MLLNLQPIFELKIFDLEPLSPNCKVSDLGNLKLANASNQLFAISEKSFAAIPHQFTDLKQLYYTSQQVFMLSGD